MIEIARYYQFIINSEQIGNFQDSTPCRDYISALLRNINIPSHRSLVPELKICYDIRILSHFLRNFIFHGLRREAIGKVYHIGKF